MASCDGSRSPHGTPTSHTACPSGLESPHAHEEEGDDSSGILGEVTVSSELTALIQRY